MNTTDALKTTSQLHAFLVELGKFSEIRILGIGLYKGGWRLHIDMDGYNQARGILENCAPAPLQSIPGMVFHMAEWKGLKVLAIEDVKKTATEEVLERLGKI